MVNNPPKQLDWFWWIFYMFFLLTVWIYNLTQQLALFLYNMKTPNYDQLFFNIAENSHLNQKLGSASLKCPYLSGKCLSYKLEIWCQLKKESCSSTQLSHGTCMNQNARKSYPYFYRPWKQLLELFVVGLLLCCNNRSNHV